MMLCYAKWYLCRRHTHIPIVEYTISLLFIFRLHRLFFDVSALTFRCKFCIPLGTSFELLRLLFRRYSRWLFVLRLIFRWYLALHSLWNDFWVENLHYAPLGTTFCIFGKLTLHSLERLFVASVILVMWFLASRSLRKDFCASATFWTSWVCVTPQVLPRCWLPNGTYTYYHMWLKLGREGVLETLEAWVS
jgi:hypothetical protein